MDDRESPTNDQQLNLQDFLPIDTRVERIKTCLTLPDENKNQLNDSKPEALKSSDATMGRVEQDSINNNENSGDYTSSCQDDETDKPPRRFTADEMLALGRCAFEKESLRKTQHFSRKDASPAQQKKTDIQATVSERNEDGNNPNPNPNPNANCSQKDPSQTLQALFSVLRKEFEQMDSQVLPLCLHQIAETYFQDGEYEKAMKFIQLERLYHEQLLANLSSIQQQWEKKWKAATSNEVPQAKYSAKSLNNEELDRLAELCTSHQEPLISRSKLISKEKSLKHEGSLGLVVSEDVKEKGAAANDSDIQTWPGIEPKKETHHGQRARSEVFQPENHCVLQEKARRQLLSGKDPMEEEPSTAESTLEPPTQATGAADTPRSGCLSPRDAEDDGGLQLREEETFSEDVAKIEAAAETSAAEHSCEPMVDTLVLTEADHGSLDLISTEDNVSSERNFLKSTPCPGSVVTSTSQLASSELSQQQPDDGNDRKSVQNRTAAVRTNVCPENNTPEQTCAAYEEGQEEKEVLGEERERREPEDFFDRFFNDSIKDREDSEIPQEQALYNSPDGYSLEESFSSLDELAKRIEIAETVPAEGLVSILKKRDDAESKALAQMQQRQSKRRVRFQEMDDTLDQEEVGGGSCILLMLLCIATVFLSVGGTALYCSFANAESPVCTEFAANVDFYYTRILQGIEELKHWISFS